MFRVNYSELFCYSVGDKPEQIYFGYGENCMSWFLYILRCKDQSLYTGITWNLKKRIKEHNTRIKSSLQLSKIPVSLVYWEKFSDRYQAANREKEIKG